MWQSIYIWGYILSYFMGSTQSTNCPMDKFKPYDCQLMSHSNKRLDIPCTVFNTDSCNIFKGQQPPKDLQLNTVRLVSMNIYQKKYGSDAGHYNGETYPALNYTFSLPNCDMTKSCQAVRVDIWNNATSSNYRKPGICRLFHFTNNSLSAKNIQQVYINHKCFTGIINEHYFLKFTTLPYITEITYSIIINYTSYVNLAVAPVHHQQAISIILGFLVPRICKNEFHLISLKTGTEYNKSSTNNSFLFENLQPGFFRVRVESSCFQTGVDIQSEIILLKKSPEPEFSMNIDFIWIVLPLILSFILMICLYLYFKWKPKFIDRYHKCVIDMLYDSNVKSNVIVADQLIKLMEEEFEWSVNNFPLDSFMTCSCELPSSNVALYLTCPDMYGKVKIPPYFKSFNVAKALLYYRPKRMKLIWVDCKLSFDIIKDIKELYYFVYRTTKSNKRVELFYERHYPCVNYIEKLKFWKNFVDFIEFVFMQYYKAH